MSWAEPDLTVASFAMQQVAMYPQYYRDVASKARGEAMRTVFAPSLLGARMQQRLVEIYNSHFITDNS
jgi:hypothetical protein